MTVLSNMAGPDGHAVRVNGHGEGEVPERGRRRTFTAAYKLRILAEYEAAEPGERGVVLRREGLYSSHLVEWRRARDAGALAGLADKPRPAKRSPEQIELERMRARAEKAERELAKTKAALDVVGEAYALLKFSPRARIPKCGRCRDRLRRGRARRPDLDRAGLRPARPTPRQPLPGPAGPRAETADAPPGAAERAVPRSSPS